MIYFVSIDDVLNYNSSSYTCFYEGYNEDNLKDNVYKYIVKNNYKYEIEFDSYHDIEYKKIVLYKNNGEFVIFISSNTIGKELIEIGNTRILI